MSDERDSVNWRGGVEKGSHCLTDRNRLATMDHRSGSYPPLWTRLVEVAVSPEAPHGD